MFHRKTPERTPTEADSPEFLVPATWEHYVLWLEGYLMNGGQSTGFRMSGDVGFGADQWIKATALATGDYEQSDTPQQSPYGRIIIPDHVTDLPPARTLYIFDDYSLNGLPDVPIYATPKFKELAPLFKEGFKNSLIARLLFDADPEHQGVLGGGYWPDKRQKTLAKYRHLSSYFNIDLPQEFINDAVRQAELARKEKECEMATPEYQQREIESLKRMVDLTNKVLSVRANER